MGTVTPSVRRAGNAILVVALAALGCGEDAPTPVAGRSDGLIPQPAAVTPRVGAFVLENSTPVVVQDPAAADVADWFASWLRGAGLQAPVVSAGAGIALGLEPTIPGDEGYRLTVEPAGIVVLGRTARGLFYGLQTLRQLLPPALEQAGTGPRRFAIPSVVIEDEPRFPYRGVMLDVSRHFFPVAFVEQLIDLAALFKMNRFHWHLTDDQGWRIEIRTHPRLTEVGGFRDEGGVRVGGFYTQEEIREVVRYAARRFVTIVPEIDLPGHSLAALAAYPQYGCTPGPFAVATGKGIYDGVLCPAEDTFRFVDDVLEEVAALFPGPQIHVGGDEVPVGPWEGSAVAREVMAREGLASAGDLLGYFVGRVAEMAGKRGRTVIAWDEILGGSWAVPATATVMSWRGVEGGVAAARRGLDTIVTPSAICYLEHYQADPATEPPASGAVMPLATVYGFDPVPAGLSPDEARHVMGSQGMLWTETIATADHAEYMLFPRLVALAEVLWSPAAARDYGGFLRRLEVASGRLDLLGVTYAAHFRRELPAP
jgi:hexosaminidase